MTVTLAWGQSCSGCAATQRASFISICQSVYQLLAGLCCSLPPLSGKQNANHSPQLFGLNPKLHLLRFVVNLLGNVLYNKSTFYMLYVGFMMHGL